MNNNLDKLRIIAKEYNIEISDSQMNQFDKYYDLLIEWNQKMNLTAITELDEVIVKHFADSISISKYLEMDKIENVIDIGTGAGFPGIPLKIVHPHLNITLLDSLNKRLIFLNEVIGVLGLNDINTIHGRAEDIARKPEYREKYDLCVSRAVANLSTLSELCIPFVKCNGLFTPYKSEKTDDEIIAAKKALHLLGSRVEKVEQFEIEDNSRSIIFIRKIENTSKKYPRKAGTPAKEPL